MTAKELSRISAKLRRVAYKTLNGRRHFDVEAAAEDIVQDVLIEAHGQAIDDAILRHRTRVRCLKHIRNMRKREPFEVSLQAVLEANPNFQQPDATEGHIDPRYALIVDEIAKFSGMVVNLFYRRYFLGQSIENIARETNRTPHAIEQAMSAAKKIIRKNLARPELLSGSGNYRGVGTRCPRRGAAGV